MESLSSASHQEAQVAVRRAALTLNLVVPEEDLEAVLAHLTILRVFADSLGDAAAEPAPVFHP